MKLSTANPVWRMVAPVILATLLVVSSQSQTADYERAFPQSKATVEKAIASLKSSLAGRLPVLDGFAKLGEHPLDHYQRAYYQTTVQVSPAPAGGSVVRVNTKVTAWYADPTAAHSGYQLLKSNGRLEADLLDQLSEQLAQNPPMSDEKAAPVASAKASVQSPTAPDSAISVPSQRFPSTDRTFSSSLSQGLGAEHASVRPDQKNADKATSALQAEADSLYKILKNQGHPKNLVAVKKSGTPVVATPSLAAKPQFLASMHDEFELLDFNADWVHVRVSGLSRGWIWRNSVEMPDGMHDDNAPASASAAVAPAADLFHVIREEASTFPGDWAPLKNKNVKIISVQKIDDNTKDAGAGIRLEYAKFLFDKGYKEIAQKPQDMAGIVVIFDSADGGMVAATLSSLAQWKAGTLSDSALWHKCFFDPPETFDSSGSSASQ